MGSHSVTCHPAEVTFALRGVVSLTEESDAHLLDVWAKTIEFSDRRWRMRHLRTAFKIAVRNACPLVVHGPAGSGRTSMAAAVCQFARSWLASPHAVVAARVLASSPAAMSVQQALASICQQVAEVSIPRTVYRRRLRAYTFFYSFQFFSFSTLQLLVPCGRLSRLMTHIHTRLTALFSGLPG